jgi:hypothetical protein
VLIEGNDDEEELELDGTLRVGPEAGVGIVVAAAGGAAADAVKGDDVGAGVVAAGGAVCAPTLDVAIMRTIPATAPLRSHLSGQANVDRLGIIVGDP